MQAIQGNRSAIDQIANALNCTTTQLQSAICNVQGAIDKVAGQVGMTSQAVINAVQQQGCEIGNQMIKTGRSRILRRKSIGWDPLSMS